jgi:intracellular septation protein
MLCELLRKAQRREIEVPSFSGLFFQSLGRSGSSISQPMQTGTCILRDCRRKKPQSYAVTGTPFSFQGTIMKLLVDFFPVVLFFIAFKVKGIFVATMVAMAASVIQIGYMYFKHRKVEPMMWLSLTIILVFGGATLILHDETFIKWKPTVLYWLFFLGLAGGQFIFRKNAIKAMLEKQIVLSEPVWLKLNLSWMLFFLILGCVNLYVAYSFSTEIWVNFKMFGILGLILLFSLLQGAMIAAWQKQLKTDRNKRRE